MPRRKIPTRSQAYEQVVDAREDLLAAFSRLTIDLRPLQEPLRLWREAVEVFTAAVQAAYDNASAYDDARSERWQASEKGQAFSAWVQALSELAEADLDRTTPVDMTIDLSGDEAEAERGDPSDAVPEAPDMPEMEEEKP
jgi:hypothetical protein